MSNNHSLWDGSKLAYESWILSETFLASKAKISLQEQKIYVLQLLQLTGVIVMTNISKKVLAPSVQAKLFNQMTDLFASVDKKKANQISYELFTLSERIMFMKRLAAIVMLSEGYSSYRVAKTLQMSETTIASLIDKMEKGAFNAIISSTKKKEFDMKKFWSTIEVLLNGGMPSMGKTRWNFLHKQ